MDYKFKREILYIMKYIFLYLVLLFSSLNGLSNDYLTQEHNISAQKFTNSSYVTKFQALSQVIESSKTIYLELNPTFEENALEYIYSYEHNNTEFLSRKITIASLYAKDSTSLVQVLLSSQNRDGGFGELFGYSSTVIDTAFALKALVNTNSNGSQITNAVNYLTSSQNDDGSWSDEINGNNIYLSAIVMHSLWLVRDKYNISSTLQAAKHYIESQSDSNGLWDKHFQSAVSLIAIAPMLSDNSSLIVSLDALKQAQLVNESWEEDPYTTVLVLQAIDIISKPVPNPDLGSISGVVKDNSNIALKDIKIVLQGMEQNLSILSNENGLFTFLGLQNGTYEVSFTLENFTKVYTKVRIENNDFIINDIIMSKITDNKLATIKGTINDSASLLHLNDVTITINGTGFLTDELGYYIAKELPLETITIQCEKKGYITNTKILQLNEAATYIYNPLLLKESDAKTVIKGILVNENSTPVNTAKIVLTGANEAVVNTDSEGFYSFSPLKAGLTTISINHADYSTVTTTIEIELNHIYSHSPILYSWTDSNVTETKVFGYVKDNNGTAISDITVSIDGTSIAAVTNLDGYYILDGIQPNTVIQTIIEEDYALYQATLQLNGAKSFEHNIVLQPFVENNISIESFNSNKEIYQAFEQVHWSAKISNQSHLAHNINIITDIFDPLGNIIEHSEESQQVASNKDKGIYILPSSMQEIQKNWNTGNYTPGIYKIQVIVEGTYTDILYDKQTILLEIAPTQRLESISLMPTPMVSTQQNSKEIILKLGFQSFSNIVLTSHIAIEIRNPMKKLIYEDEQHIELQSTTNSTSIELDPILLDFSTSGNYTINATYISGTYPNKIKASVIKVLPDIHININQSITPEIIEPHINQKATIKIQLKGVSQ